MDNTATIIALSAAAITGTLIGMGLTLARIAQALEVLAGLK